MAVAVHAMDAGAIALVLEAVQLLHVTPLGRNQTALAGKALRLIEDLAFFAFSAHFAVKIVIPVRRKDRLRLV